MEEVEGSYPSSLRHHEWEAIKIFIPAQKEGGRPRVSSIRQVINAVLYVTCSGCAWRYLPREFPPWQTVYDYFSKWVKLGIWQKIHQLLARQLRLKVGKSEAPHLVIIDGQSVRAAHGEERGWDGFKKVRGRKRQILVDSLGIIWAVRVHRGNQQETTRAHEVLLNYPGDVPKPEKILGDFGYGKSPFDVWVKFNWGMWPECRKGTQEIFKNAQGKLRKRVVETNLKPQRWIVERTFAWFNFTRRLAHDYERKTINSEAFLFISQIPLLLKRIYS